MGDVTMEKAESLRRMEHRFQSAYMRGWDSAIIEPELSNCPYRRCDFVGRWIRGRADCLAGKPLPEWARK